MDHSATRQSNVLYNKFVACNRIIIVDITGIMVVCPQIKSIIDYCNNNILECVGGGGFGFQTFGAPFVWSGLWNKKK
jgi:hypothetical protein